MDQFKDCIGNQRIIKSLQRSIEKGQVSHAYLFEGDKGLGKEKIASIFAKTLQCKEQGIEPCNHCSSCIQFDTGNHPDIQMIRMPEKEKSIKIDTIRKYFDEDIYQKPYLYPYKIYIVCDSDKMTQQAQNALLKTLEEPPAYAVIILLASSMHSFLPTVVSRTVNMKFMPYTAVEMKQYILQHFPEITHTQHELVLTLCEGNPARAEDYISSSLWKDCREFTKRMIDQSRSKTKVEKNLEFKQWEQYQDNIQLVLNLLLFWYRDILLYKEMNEKAPIINVDHLESIRDWSKTMLKADIITKMEYIQETQRNLNFHNANFQLSIEMLLLKL